MGLTNLLNLLSAKHVSRSVSLERKKLDNGFHNLVCRVVDYFHSRQNTARLKKQKTCVMFLSSYGKHEWKFGRTKNPVGTRANRRVFRQLFRVLPNLHEYLYNSIETRRTCFLFPLENSATKNRKQSGYFDHQNVIKFSLLAPSLCQQLMLVLYFSRGLETNRRA